MSERIEVGDLVRQVDGCCERTRASINYFGIVEAPYMGFIRCWSCSNCGFSLSSKEIMRVPELASHKGQNYGWVPIAWLKRIPPLSELESTEHREEIPA